MQLEGSDDNKTPVNEMERPGASGDRGESYQQYLSQALQSLQLFSRSQEEQHINEAVAYGRKANGIAADDPTNWAGARTVLGAILVQRSQWSKDVTDIEEATKMCRGAVEAVLGSEEHTEDTTSAMFTNLATALRLRYRLSSQAKHLDEGLAIFEELLQFTAEDSFSRKLCLHAKSSFLDFVSTETTDLQYEDQAIRTAREALAIEPNISVASSSMNQLVSLLEKRHMRTKSLEDFQETVDVVAPVFARDMHPSHYSAEAVQSLMGSLCDLHQMHFEATSNMESLKKAIDFNTKLVLVDRREADDPRRSALLVVGLKQKIAHYVKATGTMPTDVDIELLLKRPQVMQLILPDDYPHRAKWLNQTAQRMRDHCRDISQSIRIAEVALRTSMMAMAEIDPEQEGWGDVDDGYRESWKLWSDLTGKMPEFGVSVMMFEGKRSTWLPPEISEDNDLGIKVPYMINPGKLDPERENF